MNKVVASVFVSLVLLASPAPARAQALELVYGENFQSGAPGWTLTSTSGTVVWAPDATPTLVAGATSVFSGPASLNYNNGVDFDDGTTVVGTATSPVFNVAKRAPAFFFQCNYETETTGTAFDQRIVQISRDGFVSINFNEQLSTTPGATTLGACAAMGTWHFHSMSLDPGWGNIQIRFIFNSVDALFNNFEGWFIDDISVWAFADDNTRGGGGATGWLPCSAEPQTSGAASPFAAALLLPLLLIVHGRLR